MRPILFAISLSLSSLASADAPEAQWLGSIAIDHPGFLRMSSTPENGHPELLISSFAPFKQGTVSRLRLSPDSLQKLTELKPEPLSRAIAWPNDITEIPDEVFGPQHLAVGTGFLMPGYTTGSVAVINRQNGETFAITAAKKNYFYHRVQFQDMNGDGQLDIVTARGRKGLIAAGDGELLWLENPGKEPKGIWQEHVIAKGPDVYFVLSDLDQDGQSEIIATEFFSKKLSLHWQEDGAWQTRTIDDSIGAAFDLALHDLNGDGRKDLLLSNHEGGNKGSIYAYEIPQDAKQQTWPRHTLLTAIKTEKFGFNEASPGSAFAIQPEPLKPLPKPWIIAGGDGSTKVHRLIPISDDPNNWDYREDIIVDSKATVSQITFGDIDQDGRLELFAPLFDQSQIMVFRL